jgi:hypothetical protein
VARRSLSFLGILAMLIRIWSMMAKVLMLHLWRGQPAGCSIAEMLVEAVAVTLRVNK